MTRVILIVLCVFFIATAVAEDKNTANLQKEVADGSIVFAVTSGKQFQKSNVVNFNASLPKELRPFDAKNTQPLFTYREDDGSYVTLFEHKVAKRISTAQAVKSLENSAQVKWASVNYRYVGDPREDLKSNDPKLGEQYHHPLMQNQKAWGISPGKAQVAVAVTDDGVDLDHEDLQGNTWINSKEIPNNGIDDDNNGFIDDVNGWDFSSNDNDPRPSGGSHGTHVAGIISAKLNNGKGVSGTAPGVVVMPIRFYGSGAWTSTVVAKSYAYAVDNGAKIITTSFNINGFFGDKTYEAAIKYVYQNNVLLFNSAGNGSQKNPVRQAFHEVILVASTIADGSSDDRKSSYSNYGTGIDIAAPGGGGSAGILSTIPNNRYSRKSGTSMASPNAAAVAALIWSAHPNWTRDQVAAQLFGTCDNIDHKNSQYKGLLGAGRVNTLKAVTAKPAAPAIANAKLSKTQLDLAFSGLFQRTQVEDVKNWELTNVKTGQKVSLKLKSSYLVASNGVSFLFSNLASGDYRLTVKAANLQDPFGTSMEQDFVKDFSVK